MTFGSRPKGSKAEIEIARDLQGWWSQLEPGCLFTRTPLSGGWGKPQHREGFKAGGDLMTTAERFSFAVEVKRREGWAWSTLAAGKASPVWGWWRQACQAADEMKNHPLLIFRKNRHPWFVFIPAELVDFDIRARRGGKLHPFTSTHPPFLTYQTTSPHYDVEPVCYEWSNFLKIEPYHMADLT